MSVPELTRCHLDYGGCSKKTCNRRKTKSNRQSAFCFASLTRINAAGETWLCILRPLAGRSPDEIALAALQRWILISSGGARQTYTFGLASTGPRRSARGSAQFEHRFIDRTSVVAPGRPGRGAGTASRVESHAVSTAAWRRRSCSGCFEHRSASL